MIQRTTDSSAAVLLRLGDLVVRDIEFTTTRRRTSRDPAVRLHRATLAPYEVTWADGLPVTTATRTLADLLAAGIAASHAGSFLAEALDRRMLMRAGRLVPASCGETPAPRGARTLPGEAT